MEVFKNQHFKFIIMKNFVVAIFAVAALVACKKTKPRLPEIPLYLHQLNQG